MLQHANLDGEDVQTIQSRLIRHPFSLVIFKQNLFVTDWRLDAIIRMNKLSGGDEVIVEKVEESNRLYGIKIFSKETQLIVPNHPCHVNNGGCSELCFPVPDKAGNSTVAVCGCRYVTHSNIFWFFKYFYLHTGKKYFPTPQLRPEAGLGRAEV